VPGEEAEALLADITTQAEADRQKILEGNRSRVEAIRARTGEEIRQLESEASRRLDKRLAVERDRVLGEALQQERRSRLLARREWIDKAFAGAEARIERLSASDQYRGLLRRLIAEAAEAIGDAGEVVVARQDLTLGRSLSQELGLSCEVRGEGGEAGTVVVLSSDGLRRVDNSLGARLARARQVIEPEIARLLFHE
jgi:vacuolar-type H+-ATPase subunit E/Vma4